MNIQISNFKEGSVEDKIKSLIDINKEKLLNIGKIDMMIYLFDKNNNLYTIPIKDKKFISVLDLKKILKKIVVSLIQDIEYDKNTTIVNIVTIYESFFNPENSNKNSINLDNNKSNNIDENESFIICVEDKFSINLNIYDRISIFDNGKKHTVISKEPLKTVEYLKLDPDDKINGVLTNIL